MVWKPHPGAGAGAGINPWCCYGIFCPLTGSLQCHPGTGMCSSSLFLSGAEVPTLRCSCLAILGGSRGLIRANSLVQLWIILPEAPLDHAFPNLLLSKRAESSFLPCLQTKKGFPSLSLPLSPTVSFLPPKMSITATDLLYFW